MIISSSSGVAGRRRGRRGLLLVCVLAMSAALFAPVVSAQPPVSGAFGDDDGSVHEPALNELAARGIVAGTECGTDLICHLDPISREHVAVWLTRVADPANPTSDEPTRFSDVDPDGEFVAHIERLAELKVTVGCRTEPLRYCPDQSVTRAQMASFLVRAFDLPDAADAGFVDVSASSVHAGAINALAASGITAGCRTEPFSYCPTEKVKRGQMASFLARAAGYVDRPTPAVPAVAAPLERCIPSGTYGSGRVAVQIGRFDGSGYDYAGVVHGGAASCERIKDWWVEITRLEAARIAAGRYPCEYDMDNEDVPRPADFPRTWNGDPLYVQCWPRATWSETSYVEWFLDTGYTRTLSSDQYPPNDPAFVEALWGCYRQALMGAPDGWIPPQPRTWMGTESWLRVNDCDFMLRQFGQPVRGLGIEPECAAEQYTKRVELFTTRPIVLASSGSVWADEGMWAECLTAAQRLLPDDLRDAAFDQQCAAIGDLAANGRTDAYARSVGWTRAELVDHIETLLCHEMLGWALFVYGETAVNFEDDPDYQECVQRWLALPAAEIGDPADWPANVPRVDVEAVSLAASLPYSSYSTLVADCDGQEYGTLELYTAVGDTSDWPADLFALRLTGVGDETPACQDAITLGNVYSTVRREPILPMRTC